MVSGICGVPRTSLDDAFQAYIGEHFPNGVVTVYGSNGSYTVAIVDNKYNPRNYWYARRNGFSRGIALGAVILTAATEENKTKQKKQTCARALGTVAGGRTTQFRAATSRVRSEARSSADRPGS